MFEAVSRRADEAISRDHHSPSFRSFDVTAPDSMTVDCYKAALDPSAASDPAVMQDNSNANCRGNSRFGEWLAEFQGFVKDREAGRADSMPALIVMRFPNDHTTGLKDKFPTPQFMVPTMTTLLAGLSKRFPPARIGKTPRSHRRRRRAGRP